MISLAISKYNKNPKMKILKEERPPLHDKINS